MSSINKMIPNMAYTPEMLAKQTGVPLSSVKGEIKSALVGGFVELVQVKGRRQKFYKTKQLGLFNER